MGGNLEFWNLRQEDPLERWRKEEKGPSTNGKGAGGGLVLGLGGDQQSQGAGDVREKTRSQLSKKKTRKKLHLTEKKGATPEKGKPVGKIRGGGKKDHKVRER